MAADKPKSAKAKSTPSTAKKDSAKVTGTSRANARQPTSAAAVTSKAKKKAATTRSASAKKTPGKRATEKSAGTKKSPAKRTTASAPGKTRKGDIAKETLKSAAVRVLNRCGFHQMRIKDVTAEAGVATGLFYHYFKNLDSMVREIMEEHLTQFEAIADIERNVSKGDWFQRSLSHYQLVVKTYAEEPGLMRCIQQFAADDPAFRTRWRQSYNWRIQQLVQAFPRVFPNAKLPEADVQLVVYALSGIGQDFLNEYFVEKNPAVTSGKYSQAAIAEWLTALFYRGMFAANPDQGKLEFASALTHVVPSKR